MKKVTKYYKQSNITFIRITLLALFIFLLCIPNVGEIHLEGEHFYSIYLNDTFVGSIQEKEQIDSMMREARQIFSKKSSQMVYADANLQIIGKNDWLGRIYDEEVIVQNMVKALDSAKIETLNHAYTLKINEYSVNLADSKEVVGLLEAALNKYDESQKYTVELILDPTRELNVLTSNIIKKEEAVTQGAFVEIGVEQYFGEMFKDVELVEEKHFEDYEYGLKTIEFGNSVEIVDAYLLAESIVSYESAIDEVTMEQEKQIIYEVVAGDTLSGIAEKTNIPVVKIIEMNNALENENSTIRIGQELTITEPEPELSVEYCMQQYYEEDYEAEVIYVDNDDWFTNQSVTRQEPSAGHRKVVALESYRNDSLINREVIKEEVIYEAVPKIVERGTKIPPSYIKPLSGGRLTSNYGNRNAPTKGASTNHQGTDWAVPTGTSIVASAGGVVTKAGWGSGYGYVIYISHPDGRETRYGHLSKILVKAGQTVRQGEQIALSGNTGRSTGPHLHFELRINGKAVNVLNYIQ